LRKGQGLSQEELAGRAGLHRTYVADVERGARNLSLASIEKLAQALGVTLPALFSEAAGGADPAAGGPVDILLAEGDAGEVKLTLDGLAVAHLANRVHVVRDGAEALDFVFCTGRYARRKLPGRRWLILLSVDLPKVSGLEVLRRIKGAKPTREIPVVMLVKSRRQPGREESLRLGAETHLVKPVDFGRLAGMVAQLNLQWSLQSHSG